MWEAYELHCIGDGHDKFYRIIRSDNVVVIRYGRRGGEGARQVKVFGSFGEASEFVNETLDAKRYRRGYDIVYTDRRRQVTNSPTQEDEMEREFLERYQEYTQPRV
jgi:predicted DNA-binding WGR domain protein